MSRDSAVALRRLFGTNLDALRAAWGHDALLVTAAGRGADRAPSEGGVGASDRFGELFSPDAADELIAERGLRAPFLRVAKDGQTLPDKAFTVGGGVGAGIGDQVSDDSVRRLFADGSTIVLQGLHRTWTPIKTFSQALAAELGHPVQVNAYITPPDNQGFAAHYDVHDVFVLQITGRKRWIIHPPVFASPLRHQTWDALACEVAARASETPLIDAELAPGDVLYLPRGFVHAARALGGLTIHLTIGIHTWTGQHLADAYLDEVRAALADDPAVRASLGLGVDVGDPGDLRLDVAGVREAIETALDRVDLTQLAGRLRARARASQRPASVRPLAAIADADRLTPDTVLRLRPQLLASVETDAEGVQVTSRAGRLCLPAELTRALDRLLADEPVAARDFGEQARTLVIEGLATCEVP